MAVILNLESDDTVSEVLRQTFEYKPHNQNLKKPFTNQLNKQLYFRYRIFFNISCNYSAAMRAQLVY